MRVFLFALLAMFSLSSFGQSDSANAPFRKFPTIPPFDLLQVDSSSHFTKDNINQHQKTIVMFFSPECSHCQHQTEDMISAMDSLKQIQIVMATYQPFNEMADFYKRYQIARYKNIKMGRDIKYVLPPFYRMRSLPFLALYDDNGKYVASFEGNQKVAKLLAQYKK